MDGSARAGEEMLRLDERGGEEDLLDNSAPAIETYERESGSCDPEERRVFSVDARVDAIRIAGDHELWREETTDELEAVVLGTPGLFFREGSFYVLHRWILPLVPEAREIHGDPMALLQKSVVGRSFVDDFPNQVAPSVATNPLEKKVSSDVTYASHVREDARDHRLWRVCEYGDVEGEECMIRMDRSTRGVRPSCFVDSACRLLAREENAQAKGAGE